MSLSLSLGGWCIQACPLPATGLHTLFSPNNPQMIQKLTNDQEKYFSSYQMDVTGAVIYMASLKYGKYSNSLIQHHS